MLSAVNEEKNRHFDPSIKNLNPATLVFSNHLETLLSHLAAELLKSGTDFFVSPLIIIPSPAVEQWLKRQLADRFDIHRGVKTAFLGQGVTSLMRAAPTQALELTLFLASAIQRHLEEEAFVPVQSYVQGQCKRRMVLAQRLASLFQRYGLYGVKEWKHHWQQCLWEESCSLFPPLVDLIRRPMRKQLPIHLFGLNHLSPPLFHFFKQQGAMFYLLSPCQEFWSDLSSDSPEAQPVLLNLGKVGRQMARIVEESEIPTLEEYEEEVFPIQMALLTCSPLEYDSSIEIHAASTPMREVEILHQLLLPHLRAGIEPHEISILAPDPELYISCLRAVFGARVDLPLDRDLEVKGLQLLLALETKRWSASSVLAILRHPLCRLKWTAEQLKTVQQWVRQTGIHWGIDATHRQQTSMQGTWRGGLEQLQEIVKEDIALLDALRTFFEALVSALEPLSKNMHTPAQWAQYLLDLSTRFFESTDGVLAEKLAPLLQERHESLYPFSAFQPLLELDSHQKSNLQGIVCDSLSSMRSVPAKIMCLLGMNYGAFPRQAADSLDVLQGCAEIPEPADFDRYLFLETVLSYRHKLYIFYQGRDPLDGTPKPPSAVLDTLLPYVKHEIHPLTGYDERYFIDCEGTPEQFAICQAKRQPVHSSALFSAPQVPELPQGTLIVELRDLLTCVRTPVRHFYSALDFSTPPPLVEEDPLTCHPLALSRLRHLCLNVPHDQAIARLQKQGRLPVGPLFEAVRERILAQLAPAPTQSYELSFDYQNKGIYSLPPLTVTLGPHTTVQIVGRIDGIVERTLMIPDQGDAAALIKWWPLCLISAELGLASSWLFTKDQKTKTQIPSSQLPKLLTYYFHSQTQPSPLYPQVATCLLKHDSKRAALALTQLHDPALRWALCKHSMSVELEPWQSVAHTLYQEMFHAWV